MSGGLEQLARFEEAWRVPFEAQAGFIFEARKLEQPHLVHTKVADHFVQSLGLKPIGTNWEMLDGSGEADAPRSAIAAFMDALSNNMARPQQIWLGLEKAAECGRDFVRAFEPAQRTILTNRMDFGWHPISDAAIEWAFVGFDEHKIALLLVTAEG